MGRDWAGVNDMDMLDGCVIESTARIECGLLEPDTNEGAAEGAAAAAGEEEVVNDGIVLFCSIYGAPRRERIV